MIRSLAVVLFAMLMVVALPDGAVAQGDSDIDNPTSQTQLNKTTEAENARTYLEERSAQLASERREQLREVLLIGGGLLIGISLFVWIVSFFCSLAWSKITKNQERGSHEETSAYRKMRNQLILVALGSIIFGPVVLLIDLLRTSLINLFRASRPKKAGAYGSKQNQGRSRGEGRDHYRQHSAKPRGTRDYTYYDILGVEKTADLATIKSAYRKMAMKFHPDNADSNAWAKARFIEIQEAYEVLSDSKKRADYDKKIG